MTCNLVVLLNHTVTWIKNVNTSLVVTTWCNDAWNLSLDLHQLNKRIEQRRGKGNYVISISRLLIRWKLVERLGSNTDRCRFGALGMEVHENRWTHFIGFCRSAPGIRKCEPSLVRLCTSQPLFCIHYLILLMCLWVHMNVFNFWSLVIAEWDYS